MKPIPILLAAILSGTASTLTAQQPGAGDPFVKGDNPPAPAPGAPNAAARMPLECLVRVEVFTLPLADGRKAMRQFAKQADLYAWLGAELEKDKPAVQLEHLSLLRVRGGQRAKLEEIDEYAYPTEFDPPQIPQNYGTGVPSNNNAAAPVPVPAPAPPTPPPAPETPGANGDPGAAGTPSAASLPGPPGSAPAARVFPPWPYTPTTPSSFTYKNTGWSLEIELTLGVDGHTVDIYLAPEFIRFCGLHSQSPNGEIMQPTFESSRISCQILTTLDQPTFAGTFSPPVATGVTGGNTENVTRLMFLTVTNPR